MTSVASVEIAPLLPAAELDRHLKLTLAEKSLRGFSRFAHLLAERLLFSSNRDGSALLREARSDPQAFAAKGPFSSLNSLETRWTAAILTAQRGDEAALIALLRSNALLCPPNNDYGHLYYGALPQPRESMHKLVRRPDASQALLKAVAKANIPQSIASGVIRMAFQAVMRLDQPLEAFQTTNVKANFERGLELLCLHPFDDDMLAIAHAPNLPDLARCGLLSCDLWSERSPFFVDPASSLSGKFNGAIAFLNATLQSDETANLGPHEARNIAMMTRTLAESGRLSEPWFEDFLCVCDERFPSNGAFYAQVATLHFPRIPLALSKRASFIQAFERRELDSLAPAAQPTPRLSRSL